jgi:periplasmic protein TonB
MTMQQDAAPNIKDRMVTTLFAVILLHGIVILGVTFAPLLPGDQPYQPSLQVALLVEATEDTEAREAEYQAQTSQEGSGNSADARTATSPLPVPVSLPQEGLPGATDSEYRDPGEQTPQREILASRAEASRQVQSVSDPSEQPDLVAQRPSDQVQTDINLDVLADIDEEAVLRGDRELLITADTTASDVAVYLDGWKRKIENVGTQNYPARFANLPTIRNPTLEVVVQSDGLLREIVVLRSSGQRSVDQAALSILRLAAPFDPFPDDLRDKYDVVRFAYEWQFIADN